MGVVCSGGSSAGNVVGLRRAGASLVPAAPVRFARSAVKAASKAIVRKVGLDLDDQLGIGQAHTITIGSSAPTYIHLKVEGVIKSYSANDIDLGATFTVSGFSPASDHVKFTVSAVDVDVDAGRSRRCLRMRGRREMLREKNQAWDERQSSTFRLMAHDKGHPESRNGLWVRQRVNVDPEKGYTAMTEQSSFTAAALCLRAASASGVSLISMIFSRPAAPSLQGTPM